MPRSPRTSTAVSHTRIAACNIRRRRAELGLSRRGLTAKVRAAGHPFARGLLTRLEDGVNTAGGLPAMSVDQLVWLSDALDTTPAELLRPPTETPDAAQGNS
ncbi:hypothetical protein JIX56_19610 [Streptomyces sp. CA-210063]|uniref:hypothetical protein n=1 Tax=Streptomyces sp. CA-210063 TaxID=2801029 RepID=UPI00214CDFC7|nr:hypothetical protein [Streptomyces sp. CA-210063]UUU31929.1 hypothetical protein JIX56_19610 [Streptomyces sp. CA-210063]